ncbi:cell wall hydrolase [Prosthecochloris sp. N3]|uniref:Cell wall hydrolase n=1 Tax=Prosthecochloris ethylica TaxID=2743976 RepID=A0ABR9XPK1_9CHLB|nr:MULTISPECIES: cell wall hydrolase [Prosthecochloris]MBF0586252.1 cell wall hydrolase [Prosthecochloris ethylica]MBF0635958.1 cell wall hydrolase [Prosthecochloris ethylica]NUK47367.1 cell wall hydrolase [Prosthecochloris ethylica]RNA64922.1 cell wall hydrolase [Prosthecochloris sp. ZM_2]
MNTLKDLVQKHMQVLREKPATTLKGAVVVVGLFSMGLVMKNLISPHHAEKTGHQYNDYVESITSRELEWLARNIYHEARGESWDGMLAVGVVTMNRVRSPHYPDTIEGVVKDYKQFSWFWDGLSDRVRDREAWKRAKAAAAEVMLNPDLPIARELKDATHYHADYVDPYWSGGKMQIATIGRHIFYM